MILLIAQQGLGVAANIVVNKANNLDSQSTTASDPSIRAKLAHDAESSRQLANQLSAIDHAITTYISSLGH